MLLNSIVRILNLQMDRPKAATAEGNTVSSDSVDWKQEFSKIADDVRIPASEATMEAAAEAKGMKRIELEIAAAAGLLRPISPKPQSEPESKQYERSLEDLLRTVDELKTPPKSPNLDLFE